MSVIANMTDPRRQTRPVKVILGDALDEIRVRAQRLEAFEGELRDARTIIKTLEKLVEPAAHPQKTRQVTTGTGETHQAIIAALEGSLERQDMAWVAEKLGRKPAPWIAAQLHRLVAAGQLDERDGRYGVASPLARDVKVERLVEDGEE